jgi:hypothetical protein
MDILQVSPSAEFVKEILNGFFAVLIPDQLVSELVSVQYVPEFLRFIRSYSSDKE